jgi:K(+)-stimulated pyrophosphate-energized sodium pump
MRFFRSVARRPIAALALALAVFLLVPVAASASEADLPRIPDLNSARFLHNTIGGWTLLAWGIVVCGLGFIFGIAIYRRLKNLPVHQSMRDVSETIYLTCKTYLKTQIKFILLLEIFIGSVLVLYFGVLSRDQFGNHMPPQNVAIILLFSLIGIAGSVSVAWFGIRINTFANSRTAMGSLGGKP